MKNFSLFLVLTFLPILSFSQINFEFKFSNQIICIENNDTLDLAWAGGINTAQVNSMDVNMDGIEDLIIFDKDINKFMSLISDGQSYSYGFDYNQTFPVDQAGTRPYGWVLMRDANCDGRKDLYTKTGAGAIIYRNLNGPVNYPVWSVFDAVAEYDGNLNIQISEQDIPIIEDIDYDGDVDFAVFEFFGGGFIQYFKNNSVENNGNCNFSEYDKVTDCWGGIYECPTCGDYDINLAANCLIGGTSSNYCVFRSGQQHTGSTSLAIDLDGDNDKDLLLADIGCNEVSYLENVGNNTFSQFDSAYLGWPFNGNPINYFAFPALFYEDGDFDGVKDLFVTPNSTDNQGGLIDMSADLIMYKNSGTTSNPIFNYEKNNFLQDEMLDVGDYSHPALIDFDGDGDLDLFIGNRGRSINNDFKANLTYYENTGTVSNPEFTLVDDNFLDLLSLQVEIIRPFFHDLTGDGKKDMCFTWSQNNGLDYRINFIPNEGTGSAMMINIDSLQEYTISFPTLFRNDFPKFYDVNGDGVDDLLLAWSNFGLMRYYRNDGTISNPVFTEVNNDVGHLGSSLGNQQPSFDFADLNSDGQLDMISTQRLGEVRVYPNFLNNISSTDTLKPYKQVIGNTLLGKGNYRLNEFTKIALGDLNNDTIPDVVLGNKTGGIQILYTGKITGLNDELGHLNKSLKVYPVPSEDYVNIDIIEAGRLTIRDVLGNEVFDITLSNAELLKVDIEAFRSGIYFIQFETIKGERLTSKMIKN